MAILEEQLAALKQNGHVAKEAKSVPKRTVGSPARKSGVPTYALVVPEENEMLGLVKNIPKSVQSDGSDFYIQDFPNMFREVSSLR